MYDLIEYLCPWKIKKHPTMKLRTLVFVIVAALAVAFSTEAQKKTAKKPLIVYYSHSGNTQAVAEHIQKATGGTLFRIEPEQAYPEDYKALVQQAKEELKKGFRPKLKKSVKNIADYDVVYIGSPNWIHTLAPAVMSFLEQHNLKGKTIIPFVTHGGGGMGKCLDEMKRLAPQATILDGIVIDGKKAKESAEEVRNSLKAMGQIK